MGLKERLVAKSVGIVDPGDAKASKPLPARAPVTGPGQLGAFRQDVLRYTDEIASLRSELEVAKAAREILLADIHVVAGRKRHLSEQEFAELKANLAANPLITPISVRRKAEGGYEVIAGHNRVQAYRDLGRKSIPSVVLEMDDEIADLGAFYSNLLAPALPDFERYVGFRRRQQQTAYTHDQLAKEAGIDRSQVTKLLRFGALPLEALQLLESRPSCLGASAAAKLADLVEKGRAKEVIEAIRRLVHEPDFTQAQAIAEAAGKQALAPNAPKLIVRSGRSTYCEISKRRNGLVIQFVDATAAEKASAEIETLLKKLASGK
jgi:ParB family chromosome partitioning protein